MSNFDGNFKIDVEALRKILETDEAQELCKCNCHNLNSMVHFIGAPFLPLDKPKLEDLKIRADSWMASNPCKDINVGAMALSEIHPVEFSEKPEMGPSPLKPLLKLWLLFKRLMG